MKKSISCCLDCGDDISILIQTSSSPEIILLCTDCYNLKYSNELQKEFKHVEKKKK